MKIAHHAARSTVQPVISIKNLAFLLIWAAATYPIISEAKIDQNTDFRRAHNRAGSVASSTHLGKPINEQKHQASDRHENLRSE